MNNKLQQWNILVAALVVLWMLLGSGPRLLTDMRLGCVSPVVQNQDRGRPAMVPMVPPGEAASAAQVGAVRRSSLDASTSVATVAASPPHRELARATAVQSLPQLEQQSLWSVFHAARHAVQPLTEHEASLPQNEGVRYFAANPGQRITARFLDGAVRLQSGRCGQWTGTLQYASLNDMAPSPVAEGNRVEYRHNDGVTEWYVNRGDGIEHGFTLPHRPGTAGTSDFRLTFALDGLVARRVEPDRRTSAAEALEFVDVMSGAAVLRYDKLFIHDATGRQLPAHFTVSEGDVTITVADAGAVYPVTVDPLISSLEAKLVRDSDGDGQSGDRFGSAVAIYGDTAAIGAYLDNLAVGNGAGSTYLFVRDGTNWSLQAKLSASDGSASDGFGFAVALFGNRLLVGAPFDDSASGVNLGAGYVFERSGTSWTELSKLVPDDGAANDNFAYSVGLSTNSAVLGAYLDDTTASDTGSAYVFAMQAGVWIQEQKLLASDKAATDRFGTSVDISADSIIVGSPEDDNSRGSSAGAAYIFTRSGASWVQQAKLLASGAGGGGDLFGGAVSLSGDTALIGADRYNFLSSGGSIGAAYVFVRNGSTWSQQTRLTASDATAGDRFGSSLAVFGNTALVGSFQDGTAAGISAGSAYIFVRNGTSWSQQAKIEAPDAAAGDQFGRRVALYEDTAVIGVWVDATSAGFNVGSAHVYFRSNGVWGYQTKLTSGDANTGELFGRSVSVSGDTALVGANGDSTATEVAVGAAYVFVRNGATWSFQAKLTPNDGDASDNFGKALAISDDTALISSERDPTGSAYVFTRIGTNWSQQAKLFASDAASGDGFGAALALDGETALVGAPTDATAAGSGAGSAYIFVRTGTYWSEQTKLTAGDGAGGDNFGRAVALDDETALVGAFADDTAAGTDAGSAYVFVRSGATWSQQAKLIASDGAANDYFGQSVDLSGHTALVGASEDDTTAGVNAGSAYAFIRSGTLWSLQAKLEPSDAAADDRFGSAVALSGDTALVGAFLDDTLAGANAGSAYVFVRNEVVWNQAIKLEGNDVEASSFFGEGVAVDGDTILIGATFDDAIHPITGDPLRDQGSVYVFRLHETQPPVANPDAAGVSWGATLTIPAIKLLANDADPEGQPLSLTAVQSPSLLGAAVSLAGGVVTYIAPGSGTTDSFTYTVSDPLGASATGTVNVALSGGGLGFNQLMPELLQSGAVKVNFLGIPGLNYALQRTHSLVPPVNWENLMTNTVGANGRLAFTNPPSLAPTNDYYRTRHVP